MIKATAGHDIINILVLLVFHQGLVKILCTFKALKIHISQTTQEALRKHGDFVIKTRGDIEIKVGCLEFDVHLKPLKLKFWYIADQLGFLVCMC